MRVAEAHSVADLPDLLVARVAHRVRTGHVDRLGRGSRAGRRPRRRRRHRASRRRAVAPRARARPGRCSARCPPGSRRASRERDRRRRSRLLRSVRSVRRWNAPEIASSSEPAVDHRLDDLSACPGDRDTRPDDLDSTPVAGVVRDRGASQLLDLPLVLDRAEAVEDPGRTLQPKRRCGRCGRDRDRRTTASPRLRPWPSPRGPSPRARFGAGRTDHRRPRR